MLKQKNLPLGGNKIFGREAHIRFIGRFGAKLAQRILDCDLLDEWDERGDLVNHNERFWAEVKTAGKDRAGFDEGQFSAHLEGDDDYARRCVIVKYKNYRYDPVSKSIVRAVIALTPTKRALYSFLVESTVAVYVLDSIVVESIRKRDGCTWALRRGWGSKRPCIRVSWKLLCALGKNPAKVLTELGLEQSVFRVSTENRVVRMGCRNMKIELISVLRADPERQMDPCLAGPEAAPF